jgi:hypothetical protein
MTFGSLLRAAGLASRTRSQMLWLFGSSDRTAERGAMAQSSHRRRAHYRRLAPRVSLFGMVEAADVRREAPSRP